ncbi:hypothetical protein BOSEA1005_21701 [Hyphomicrobiales bacterium]|nr:hypothetical protein BOSEA1005_21701 [Hyphomicrobiales bacterium]
MSSRFCAGSTARRPTPSSTGFWQRGPEGGSALFHPIDLLRPGKASSPDLGGIIGHGLVDAFGEVAEELDEFRHAPGQAEHVVEHKYLPVAGRRGADADGRDRDPGGDIGRERLGHCLQHHGEGTGLRHRLGIGDDRRPFRPAAPLGLEAAEHVHRLRRQPDMRHHRDAALDQEGDGLRHALPAFELQRPATGFLHDAGGVTERLFRAFLVAAEGHVDDDQRPPGAAHHRLPVQDHHFQRHRHGTVEAVHDHAEGIPDKQKIAVAIRQRRHGGGVGRQRNDRFGGLAAADVQRGQAPDLCLRRHVRLPISRPKQGKGPKPFGAALKAQSAFDTARPLNHFRAQFRNAGALPVAGPPFTGRVRALKRL